MSETISIINLKPIQKIFNEYKIILNPYMDIINIKIENNYSIYESNFNLEFLCRLLVLNYTIKEMIEFINGLIDQNNIKIEENEINLKLIKLLIMLMMM